jgi:hypothetical protein
MKGDGRTHPPAGKAGLAETGSLQTFQCTIQHLLAKRPIKRYSLHSAIKFIPPKQMLRRDILLQAKNTVCLSVKEVRHTVLMK